MLSMSSASAGDQTGLTASGDEYVNQCQIEADYYRNKAAALMQKYEPPANDEDAVSRVVLDVLKIRADQESSYLSRLNKAPEVDRAAIYVSELYLDHIQREIAAIERA